ncbi:MAG: penicillin-binding protein 2 [Alphaproteobacteria bacterium]|nr:penicillin-binding protein 2 [Alphaproteobacteria bacterium]
MSRTKLPLVPVGHDWAMVLGGRLGRRAGDLAQHAVETTRSRLRLALICFFIVFTVLGGRLVQLTVLDAAPAQHAGVLHENRLARPAITDRNNVVLATQISTVTLGADAAKIKDGADMAVRLKAVLPRLDGARAARLLSGKSHYVTLLSGLTPAQKQDVLAFGNPALKLTHDTSRVYPAGEVTAHTVGFTSSDMRGLSGLELYLDRVQEEEDLGGELKTSLDIRVQHAVRDVLSEAIETFQALAGGAVVIDVHNGEILALISMPDFDANAPMRNGHDSHFNRMTLGVYELGSIFKVFTAAMALDSGLVSPSEMFDTAEPLKIGRYEIDDLHGEARPLSVREIIIHSSNIGSAKLALRVPDDLHYDFLQRLGFTDALEVELPERSAPLTPTRWTDIERATSSYGHGISVTPLHAVMAGAAMVNGGILYKPSLRKVGLPVGERIISAKTSADMRDMMRAVVAGGTGRQAEVPGYQVLGKTGSAEKPQAGGYNANALVTSFLGAFPAHAPRYAMLVMLDEPQATAETYGYNLAGWNAAPAAGEIVRRIAPLLGVLPHFENPDKQAARDVPTNSTEMADASR